MLTSNQVASFFLFKANQAGVQISNLKLQKLLYYAQGYSLALTNKPMFDDTIVAWDHGPVVSSVYHQYKDCGKHPIYFTDTIDLSDYCLEFCNILDFVFMRFRDMGAWALRNKTHGETPWLNHSSDGEAADGSIISHEELHDFFSQHFPSDDYFMQFKQDITQSLDSGYIELPETVDSEESFLRWIKETTA